MFFKGRSPKPRKAIIQRKTSEVYIQGRLNIDGSGETSIRAPIEPVNHLLTLFAFHGFFDLTLDVKGDLQHHIIEDIGIALGKAFAQALGEKRGIKRYGCFSIIMDEVVVEVDLDIGGRPHLEGIVASSQKESFSKIINNETFDETNINFSELEDLLKMFLQHAGISLAYIVKSAKGDLHHILEALFKAMGKALDEASSLDSRRLRKVPSTKGIID
jgi:imidazoleglycerol-phosphate dehydratase